MVTLVLGLVPSDEARLRQAATRYGHQVLASGLGAHDLEALVRVQRPWAVVVSASPQFLTPRLLATCDDLGVRVVALVGSEMERRHAASVGLYETVDATADWPTIELLVGGSPPPPQVPPIPPMPVAPAMPAPSAAAMLPMPAAAQAHLTPAPLPPAPLPPAPPQRGQVIAVWGPSGAPGRTTLAIGIASELAALGYRVALADVDTHGAAVAPTLGLLDEAPGFAAACRLASSDTLNSEELDRVAQEYRGASSFRVLTGIGAPRRWPELSAERVTKVIAQCRSWVDFTVIDTAASLEHDEELSSDLLAPRRNAATIAALREADRVVAVGSADPVGMSRLLRAHGDLIETSGSPRVDVVMNRVRASAIGLAPAAQIRETLARFGNIHDPVLVPHDQSALDGAVLSGRTLLDVSPRSGPRRAIEEFVAARLVPTADPVRGRGRRQGR